MNESCRLLYVRTHCGSVSGATEKSSPYRKLPRSGEESPSPGCEQTWRLTLPVGEPSGKCCVSPTVSLTADHVAHARLWLGILWLSMVTHCYTQARAWQRCASLRSQDGMRCKLPPTMCRLSVSRILLALEPRGQRAVTWPRLFRDGTGTVSYTYGKN